MNTAALFTIARKWKPPMFPSSTDKYDYKNVVHSYRKMKFVGKWMELDTIILSEETQTQKDKHHMFSRCVCNL